MKFKGKQIKILYVKFKHKETNWNRQEQMGTDGNRREKTGTDRNRQELLHPKEIHISDRKSRSKEQTGTDRNRQDYVSDIKNCCIIKKFIYQIGNLGANINSYLM